MAINQTGIAIVIKAWLPTGKTLDEQFEALSLVKSAHETGDYSALLATSSIEEVKTEQKNRRVEDKPATLATTRAEPASANDGAAEPDTEDQAE